MTTNNAPPLIIRIPPKEKDWGPSWDLPSKAKGLGSGDAPVIMGISSFQSLYALWAQKTGHVPREDISGKPYVEWGNILERPIAEKYARATGRLLIDRAESEEIGRRFDMRYHAEKKFMNANLDYEIADPLHPFKDEAGDPVWLPKPGHTFQNLLPPGDGSQCPGRGALEVKTASVFGKEDWVEEPPLPYQMQLQHQLAVTGAEWGSIAVLLGGNDYRQFDMVRDDAFLEVLIEREERFWFDHVMADIPPEVDGHEKTKDALAKLYPDALEKIVKLSEKATEGWNRVMELKAQIRELYQEKDRLENIVRAELGDAMVGEMADGSGIVRYPTVKVSAHEVKASSYRRFYFRANK